MTHISAHIQAIEVRCTMGCIKTS